MRFFPVPPTRTDAPPARWARRGGLLACSLLALASACGPGARYQEGSDLREQLFEAGLGNDLPYDHPRVPPRLRRVVQYAGRGPLNIAEYDRRGRLTFHYYRQYVGASWPGGYLTMIWAHVYRGDRLARTYALHSNTGVQVRDYVDGGGGYTVQEYVRDFPGEAVARRQANDNPYRAFARVQDFPAVLREPAVQALAGPGGPRLRRTQVYGRDGLLDEDVYWDETGAGARTTVHTYAADRQPAGQVSTSAGTVDETVALAYDARRRLAQALVLGAARDTVHLRRYRYAAQGRVQDTFDFVAHVRLPGSAAWDEYRKTSFRYAPDGACTQETVRTLEVDQTTGFGGEGQLRAQTGYRYNPEGYVVETVTHDYQTKATTRQHYRYTYAYWPPKASSGR